MTDIIIDNMDQQWLLGFGIDLLGVSDLKEQAISDWVGKRRPSLRQCVPYFIFMLSVNLFFCLALPTQLLRNVKPSHHIDLAYLYYLPFCSIFMNASKALRIEIGVSRFIPRSSSAISSIRLRKEWSSSDRGFPAVCFSAVSGGNASILAWTSAWRLSSRNEYHIIILGLRLSECSENGDYSDETAASCATCLSDGTSTLAYCAVVSMDRWRKTAPMATNGVPERNQVVAAECRSI